MGRIWADPEALIAAASLIQHDYGTHGYRVVDAETPGFSGAILLTARAGDGGQFYVGATRHGQTVSGLDKEQVSAELQALMQRETEALK